MLDGTLDGAAAAIDAIPMAEMEKGAPPAPDRAADGKFKAQETEQPPVEKAPDVEAKAPDTKDEAESDDDETYVELPPEVEGKEPARYKLNEVIEGWRKAQTLEQELAKAKEVSPAPEAWETEIIQTVQARQQHMDAIAQWARINKPQPPDVSLLDPRNPHHDPDTYFAQHQQYNALLTANQEAEKQYNALSARQSAEQEAIAKAYRAKEMAKLAQVWPEYAKEKAVAEKARADLKAQYGFDDATIDSVADHRFYALARDALAHRSQKATAQQVAKVVTAKPKLIPGKARASTTGKAAAFSQSFGNLQKSGSLDDAAAAISHFL